VAAHPGTGDLYVLGGGGDVTRIDPRTGSRRRVLGGTEYVVQPRREAIHIPLPIDAKWVNAPITMRATLFLGLGFDRENRLYIVANVLLPGKDWINRVDIYRTPPVAAPEGALLPKLWTRFDHPYGVGAFNHGACRIAQGPDGKIYLGVGSRTDHGEAGDQAHISKLGEAPHPDIPGGEFTAVILRFDPARGQQTPEVYARGIRNPFGFDWDDRGRLVAVDHGPMADHPEELNHVRQGKHYGFPYVFGNGEKPDYPDSPRPPEGVLFEPPLQNLGPGGLRGDHPLYSLSAHAAPCGLVFYPAQSRGLPRRYEYGFFVARFGNLVNYDRVGFDVLHLRLEEEGGKLAVRAERVLDRLARPIDLCVSSGKLYVLEYCRQTESSGPGSEGYTLGGRLLEVSSTD